MKGAGEPLLLLHGYPQTHLTWRDVAPALAQSFKVVCADLRGYGDSSNRIQDDADFTAGRKITCPNLILWGKQGVIGKLFDPLESWRDLIDSPAGEGLDCGHFIPEEQPAQTAQLLRAFMQAVS